MSKSISSSRTARARRKSESNAVGIWLIGIAVTVVLLVVVLLVLRSQPTTVAVAKPDVPAEWMNRNVLGKPDAPVTVTMWEDFLCPACQQWTSTIEPQLIQEYVKDGKVKLEFRQFPLSGHMPETEQAAMASLCAADQGAFWTYHNRLFAAQSRGKEGYTLDALVQYADELQLDSRTFLQCMSSQKYKNELNASLQEATALKLSGTPSIFVDGQPVADWSNYDVHKSMIDAALAGN
jgi:protein-disulfide isomerase